MRVDSCYKRTSKIIVHQFTTMADDNADTLVTEQFREGPGSSGGIPKSDPKTRNAEQSKEGPGNGGILGSAKRGVKRKLDTKTLEDKYLAIMEVEKGQKSKTEIAKMFNIPKNTLSGWIKKSESIKEGYEKFGPKRKLMRSGNFEELESVLLKWFVTMRDRDVAISGPLLLEKANQFAEQLEIHEFKQSNGWLDRFKERHGISFKKICGESKSVDSESNDMLDWEHKLDILLKSYDPKDIFNADETGLFYRLTPEKTLEFKSVDCKGGKRSKERLTVLVCSNMSGSEKVPLLVIGKASNPRCFKNVKTLPTQYENNKKAWMTSEIFKQWLVKLDKKFQNQNRKVAMIVDNCPAHPNVKGLKAIKLVFLPPNTTSHTQPMDQGIIKNLKSHYRKLVILKQIQSAEKKEELHITVLDAMRLLRQSWSMVKQTTIVNCYRHAKFVQTNTDPIEEEDDPEDEIPLAQLAQLRGDNINIEQFVNIDNELPTCEETTDDDLISEFKMSRNTVQDEPEEIDSDEPEPEVKPVPTMKAVLEAADVFDDFYAAEDNCEEELALLYKLRQKLIQRQFKKKLCAKQSDIATFLK